MKSTSCFILLSLLAISANSYVTNNLLLASKHQFQQSQQSSTYLHVHRQQNGDNGLDSEKDTNTRNRREYLKAASALLLSQPVLDLFISDNSRVAFAKDLKEDYRQGTAALANSDDQAPVPREAYKKLESGVVYADLRPGSGTEAKTGSKINLQWVLRKSNGFFVDSSERNGSVPFIFTIGDGKAIPGLDEGIRGIKEGGTRRILIPPSLAYVKGVDDGLPGPIPVGFGPRQQIRRVQSVRKDVPGEYLFLEVQATRVR